MSNRKDIDTLIGEFNRHTNAAIDLLGSMKVEREFEDEELKKAQLYDLAWQIKVLGMKREAVKDWWFKGQESLTAEEVAGVQR